MDQDLLQQHKEIYYGSIQELITNNTKAFVEDDLIPFFEEPPLETMDQIKQRLLSLAKDYSLILNTKYLDQVLKEYRKKMQEEVKHIGKIREEQLKKELDKMKANEKEEIFRLLKKDFVKLNKKLKKEYKQELLKNIQQTLGENIKELFIEEELPEKLKLEVTTFFNKSYPNQLIDSYSMKILVKDTILMNAIKEQTARFLFTKANSHLFD